MLRTNGFVDSMNRALPERCMSVAKETTWYAAVDRAKANLDRFLTEYQRRHTRATGWHMEYRRVPCAVVLERLPQRECSVFDEIPQVDAQLEAQSLQSRHRQVVSRVRLLLQALDCLIS
jgi:hypothetical protein